LLLASGPLGRPAILQGHGYTMDPISLRPAYVPFLLYLLIYNMPDRRAKYVCNSLSVRRYFRALLNRGTRGRRAKKRDG
jgi:hypothetical protein